jgi:heat shock protein HtpX
MNRLKTVFLLAVLTALFLWVGDALGGPTGLLIALMFAGAMNFGAWWFSDRIVLRMHGAREVTPAEAPELYATVRELSVRGRLPMPRVYIIPEEAPNAFATGRDPAHGAVAVTQGLVRYLNRDEVAAVIAHELGHIRNRDTLIMTVAAALGGALSMLANMAMFSSMFGGNSDDEDSGSSAIGGLLGIMLAPIVASLIQMAISRSREFLADSAGAAISGNPIALANALQKIERWSHEVPMRSGSPATAHLYIANPFVGGGIAKLFSTHPPTAERVARLEQLSLRHVELSASGV